LPLISVVSKLNLTEAVMKHFSLLDLSPIPEGKTATDALENTVALAQAAEGFGYHRYWLAEHHNMPGIASAATAIVIGNVASATKKMRIGAGGIMLPNHAPLVIAEQFGTLATLYPNRIDLGLGRAPGSDMATARALRRHMTSEDNFPSDVVELLGYFNDSDDGERIQAIPGRGTQVPIWILGSSLYGARLAANLGLPYAFASHFAPTMLEEALSIYRRNFQPSEYLTEPYVVIGVGVCAAETDEEAIFLRSSQVLAFARLMSGKPGKLPAPRFKKDLGIPAHIMAQVEQSLSCSATGSVRTIKKEFSALIELFRPDELMVTGMIHDHQTRVRSFGIASEVLVELREKSIAA
jgi:luciferase family oxidoreductase group 1